MSLLPKISSAEEYQKLFPDNSIWEAGVRAVADRHGIKGDLVRGVRGSHIVYRCGDVWIKMMTPIFAHDMAFEIEGLRAVQGRLSVSVPEILFEGELEGWKYLVTSEVSGQRIGDVWPGLSLVQRVSLAETIGNITMELQQCDMTAGVRARGDWNQFIDARFSGLMKHHREKKLSEPWLKGLETFMSGFSVSEFKTDEPVFLHADLTADHFLVEQMGIFPIVTGVIDFADCCVGHPEYDLPASGVFIFREEAEALRAYVESLGFFDMSSEKLMAWTILHKYSNLEMYFHKEMEKMATEDVGDFYGLSEKMFPL